MNPFEAIELTSGLLQFVVACYALRACRRYGTARAGWWLFSAFTSLVLVHLIFSIHPRRGQTGPDLKADLFYMLLSALLLVVMVYMESLLKGRLRLEAAEQQARVNLESRVLERTAELSSANAKLQQTAARFEAEAVERKRMQEESERIHKDMLTVSRQAGMSEVATGVLHNVGNVLNSVNVSATLVADHLAGFKIGNIGRVAGLLREHAGDLGHFLTHDPKGSQLPSYLAELAKHLAQEQDLLLREINFVRTKIEHIKEIVATQQSYGKVLGLAEEVKLADLVEDVLRMQAGELTEHSIQIQRMYESSVPEVVVDKHKVLQILLNLLSNAKHACIESSQSQKLVTVRITAGNARVRVAMSDNGVGIPAANMTRVFNHGFTTRKKGGHGFGLHSGALAAREMGGTLVAHSDGPGKGATFTLELPLKSGSHPANG